MNDYERIARPTYVPPLMLKIVAANLVLWLIVLPLVLGISNNLLLESLTVAICGVPLVGAVLLGMFISRLIAYGYYALFWFWQGLFALIWMTLGVVALVAILFLPDQIPANLQLLQFEQSEQLRNVLAGMLPGAMIGVSISIAVALIIWKLWPRKRKAESVSANRSQIEATAPATVQPVQPKPKELSYLNDWQGRKG